MRKDLGVKPYLYPQPVLVIGTYNEDGSTNAMVAAWGSVSDMNQIAIYVANSHKTMDNIKARKFFTVSMATEKDIKAIDYLGIASGHKVADKFAKSGLTAIKSEHVDAPLIAELPLHLLRHSQSRLLLHRRPHRQCLQRRKSYKVRADF